MNKRHITSPQATVHRQDLLRVKAKSSIFWDTASVVLLRQLANDAYRLSKATEFDDLPMMHVKDAGKKSFDDQLDYYKSLDTWVLRDAADHVIHGKLTDEGLELDQYSGCFEYGDYMWHYEFVSSKGIEKLKLEWPTIWEKYELHKYF